MCTIWNDVRIYLTSQIDPDQRCKKTPPPDLATSILYDETTFYNHFTQDLLDAKEEVIIESPFITTKRMRELRPIFEKLINKGVKVYVITRDPREHSEE